MATYTLPAHQAMFNGFLPHVFEPLPFYNRFVQQLWRISHRNVDVKPLVVFPEGTVNIVDGFRRRGYATLGVAAMVPASPMPLTPSWLVGDGVTV